jgi:hypothetical protein
MEDLKTVGGFILFIIMLVLVVKISEIKKNLDSIAQSVLWIEQIQRDVRDHGQCK